MSVNWRAVGLELALLGDREIFLEILKEINVNRLTPGTLALTISPRTQITSPSAQASRKAT
jgi:hypothetical protein